MIECLTYEALFSFNFYGHTLSPSLSSWSPGSDNFILTIHMFFEILGKNSIVYMYFDTLLHPKGYIEDITRPRVDMNFIFEWLTRYLTSERSERVSYRVEHEKIKFISISEYVIFCLFYKHQ